MVTNNDTPRVDALMAEWDDDGATRGSAFIELRDLARELESELARRSTSGSDEKYPHPDCDWACHYHCTEAGAHPPKCDQHASGSDGTAAANPWPFCAHDGTCSCAKFHDNPEGCERRTERGIQPDNVATSWSELAGGPKQGAAHRIMLAAGFSCEYDKSTGVHTYTGNIEDAERVLAQQAVAPVEQVKEAVEQYRKGYRHGYEEGRAEIAAPAPAAEEVRGAQRFAMCKDLCHTHSDEHGEFLMVQLPRLHGAFASTEQEFVAAIEAAMSASQGKEPK